jgi:hypothetical protein
MSAGQPEGLRKIARALAWVLPFSAHGGLKDLKKRSIRRTGNLAILRSLVSTDFEPLSVDRYGGKDAPKRSLPAVLQTSRKK